MVEKKVKKLKEPGVTVRTAAELLNVSIHTLRNWDKSGKLPSRRGTNRYRYYHIRDIVSFAKEQGLRIRNAKNRPAL